MCAAVGAVARGNVAADELKIRRGAVGARGGFRRIGIADRKLRQHDLDEFHVGAVQVGGSGNAEPPGDLGPGDGGVVAGARTQRVGDEAGEADVAHVVDARAHRIANPDRDRPVAVARRDGHAFRPRGGADILNHRRGRGARSVAGKRAGSHANQHAGVGHFRGDRDDGVADRGPRAIDIDDVRHRRIIHEGRGQEFRPVGAVGTERGDTRRGRAPEDREQCAQQQCAHEG